MGLPLRILGRNRPPRHHRGKDLFVRPPRERPLPPDRSSLFRAAGMGMYPRSWRRSSADRPRKPLPQRSEADFTPPACASTGTGCRRSYMDHSALGSQPGPSARRRRKMPLDTDRSSTYALPYTSVGATGSITAQSASVKSPSHPRSSHSERPAMARLSEGKFYDLTI